MLPDARRLLTLFTAALLVALASACGGGDDGSPTETAGSPGASTTATSTPGVGKATLDLASQGVQTIVYGAGEGDFPSDQPALAAGDLDGDGLSDLVIGARFADPPAGVDAGAVYVVFGAPSFPATVDLAQGQQGLTITGPGAGVNLGFSAAISDLNGDGAADLIAGAAFATTSAGQTGRVYVFLGPLRDDGSTVPADSANIVLSGQTASGFFGDSVRGADVSGDGVADLIIGATFDTRGSRQVVSGGAAYVFFGRTAWPATMTPAEADVSIFGAEDLDELGDFVSSGDVNGDGIDDVIVTAEAADGPANDRPVAAEVYILYGGAGLTGDYNLATDVADAIIYGANSHDTLGFSIAAGDLDGDGAAELAMGARLAEAQGVARAGVVYVLHGGDIPKQIDLASPPDSVKAIRGAGTSDELGGILYIGDVNGDGHNELLAGSRQASPAADRPLAGAVYVVQDLPQAALSSIADDASLAIYGASAGDSLGGNVVAADFSGDGRPELAIMAENAPGPGDDTRRLGRVYIVSLP